MVPEWKAGHALVYFTTRLLAPVRTIVAGWPAPEPESFAAAPGFTRTDCDTPLLTPLMTTWPVSAGFQVVGSTRDPLTTTSGGAEPVLSPPCCWGRPSTTTAPSNVLAGRCWAPATAAMASSSVVGTSLFIGLSTDLIPVVGSECQVDNVGGRIRIWLGCTGLDQRDVQRLAINPHD